MTDTAYNGWTNYATWRVNLEMFDGFNPVAEWGLERETLTEGELAFILKEHAEELVCAPGRDRREDLAVDYALAFMDDVNWHEIASHMLEDYLNDY